MKLLEYLSTCDISVLKYINENSFLIYNREKLICIFESEMINNSKTSLHRRPFNFNHLCIDPSSNKCDLYHDIIEYTNHDVLFQQSLIHEEIALIKKIQERGIAIQIEYHPQFSTELISKLDKLKYGIPDDTWYKSLPSQY